MSVRSWASGRPAVAALSLAAAVIVASALLALFPVVQRWNGDVRLFENYAELIFSGRLGETPFLSWYPPLSLVPLAVPLLAGGGAAYTFLLGVEMAAVASGGGILLSGLRADRRERLRVSVIYGALVLAATTLVAWRYDIVPAVLTLAALWATSRRRWSSAGVTLGLAAGLKLYAAILAPLLLLHAWRSGGSAAAVRAGIAGVAVGAVSVASYALFPGSSPLDLLSFTASRPLHLEAVPGSVIGALASIGATEANIELGFGSFNIEGSAADAALAALRIVQPLVLATSLGVGAYAIWRRSTTVDAESTLVLAWMAALLGLFISNRVLSAQYVVWILPFVPLATGRLVPILVSAILLTVVIFPWLYTSLLALDPLPVFLVLVRNGLLIAGWTMVILRLVRPTADVDRPPNVSRDQGDAKQDGGGVVDPQVRDDRKTGQRRRADSRPAA